MYYYCIINIIIAAKVCLYYNNDKKYSIDYVCIFIPIQ